MEAKGKKRGPPTPEPSGSLRDSIHINTSDEDDPAPPVKRHKLDEIAVARVSNAHKDIVDTLRRFGVLVQSTECPECHVKLVSDTRALAQLTKWVLDNARGRKDHRTVVSLSTIQCPNCENVTCLACGAPHSKFKADCSFRAVARNLFQPRSSRSAASASGPFVECDCESAHLVSMWLLLACLDIMVDGDSANSMTTPQNPGATLGPTLSETKASAPSSSSSLLSTSSGSAKYAMGLYDPMTGVPSPDPGYDAIYQSLNADHVRRTFGDNGLKKGVGYSQDRYSQMLANKSKSKSSGTGTQKEKDALKKGYQTCISFVLRQVMCLLDRSSSSQLNPEAAAVAFHPASPSATNLTNSNIRRKTFDYEMKDLPAKKTIAALIKASRLPTVLVDLLKNLVPENSEGCKTSVHLDSFNLIECLVKDRETREVITGDCITKPSNYGLLQLGTMARQYAIQLGQNSGTAPAVARAVQDAVKGSDTLQQFLHVANKEYEAKIRTQLQDLCTQAQKVGELVSTCCSFDMSTAEDATLSEKAETIQFETKKPVSSVEILSAQVIMKQHSYGKEADAIDHSTTLARKRMRHLLKDLHILQTSLPEGILVKIAEDRFDVMKVLITGPRDTPYALGLYEFDIFCPPKYPEHPPKVLCATARVHNENLNPNLYAGGKVCLSLINTWAGARHETWQSNSSTMLQVLISIQSMIFCSDPWFNEPGHTGIHGSRYREDAREKYNRETQARTLYVGMLHWIKDQESRQGIWTDAIENHFKTHAAEICAQAIDWGKDNKSVQDWPVRLPKELLGPAVISETTRKSKPASASPWAGAYPSFGGTDKPKPLSSVFQSEVDYPYATPPVPSHSLAPPGASVPPSIGPPSGQQHPPQSSSVPEHSLYYAHDPYGSTFASPSAPLAYSSYYKSGGSGSESNQHDLLLNLPSKPYIPGLGSFDSSYFPANPTTQQQKFSLAPQGSHLINPHTHQAALQEAQQQPPSEGEPQSQHQDLTAQQQQLQHLNYIEQQIEKLHAKQKQVQKIQAAQQPQMSQQQIAQQQSLQQKHLQVMQKLHAVQQQVQQQQMQQQQLNLSAYHPQVPSYGYFHPYAHEQHHAQQSAPQSSQQQQSFYSGYQKPPPPPPPPSQTTGFNVVQATHDAKKVSDLAKVTMIAKQQAAADPMMQAHLEVKEIFDKVDKKTAAKTKKKAATKSKVPRDKAVAETDTSAQQHSETDSAAEAESLMSSIFDEDDPPLVSGLPDGFHEQQVSLHRLLNQPTIRVDLAKAVVEALEEFM